MPVERENTNSGTAAAYYKAAERSGGMALRAFGTLGGVDTTAKVFTLNDQDGEHARDEMSVQTLMGLELSGGVNLGNAAIASQLAELAREEEEKKKTEDQMFDMMLDQLQREADYWRDQEKYWGEQADKFQAQQDAAEIIMAESQAALDQLAIIEESARKNGGKPDENDPRVQAAAHRLGLNPQDLDTPEEREKLRKELQAKYDQAAEVARQAAADEADARRIEEEARQKAKAAEESRRNLNKDNVAAAFKTGQPVDLTKHGFKEDDFSAHKLTHPGFDIRSVTQAEYLELAETAKNQAKVARDDYSAKNKDATLSAIDEIAAPKGSVEYERKLDTIVKKLDFNQAEALLKNPDVSDATIREKLEYRKFETLHEMFSAERGLPTYKDTLEECVLPTLSEKMKAKLMADENAPPEIRQILKEEAQSSSPQQVSTLSGPSA